MGRAPSVEASGTVGSSWRVHGVASRPWLDALPIVPLLIVPLPIVPLPVVPLPVAPLPVGRLPIVPLTSLDAGVY